MNGRPQLYADLKNDYMFKRIFGSEECKDILKVFLNHIIRDTHIRDLSFINTEVMGMTEEDSKVIVDIACIADDGSEFIVEMQNARQEHFRERALFYTSYPLQHQKALARQKHKEDNPDETFKWDFELTPVRLIAVVNFAFEHNDDWPANKSSSSYHIIEDECGETMTDKLQFIFLELERFDKTESELVTPYDKWMYLFKHLEEMTLRPETFSDKEFDHLFDSANITTFTPEQYEEYQQHENMKYDYQNCLDYQYSKGLKEGHSAGLEEGLKQGREKLAEEKIKIAKTCLEMGMDIPMISTITKLTDFINTGPCQSAGTLFLYI